MLKYLRGYPKQAKSGLAVDTGPRQKFVILSVLLLSTLILLVATIWIRGDVLATLPNGVALSMRQVSGGFRHSCAIASDNWAYCWGEGTSGQLGSDGTSSSSSPVALSRGSIPSGATIRSVSAGAYHTCAIASDGWAYCWGSNDFGKLGDNTATQRNAPVAINQGAIPAGATILQVTTAADHTCVIANNNKAYCWGGNEDGQLGDGTNTDRSTPVAVSQGAMPSGAMVSQISAAQSGWHTCAIAMNNRAYCWGNNWRNNLGDGSGTNRNTPTLVSQGAMPSGAMVRQISSGRDYSCAISSDNRAYCWGYNNIGQLGDNSVANRSTPVAVNVSGVLSGKTILNISSGESHTCATASDSKAYCWGHGGDGSLGRGSTTNSSVPVTVSVAGVLSGKLVDTVVTGDDHTCAITSEGEASCWGLGAEGQLGNGLLVNQNMPIAISLIYSKVTMDQSVFRLYKTSADTAPGQPFATSNSPATLDVVAEHFRIRLGLTNTMREMPSFTAIESGRTFSCASSSSDWAYCWGEGTSGQLGNGSATDSSSPVALSRGSIPNSSTIRSISAGANHACVLASDKWVYCWGENEAGQLGDNTTTQRNAPVALNRGAIPAGATVLQITTAADHTCVIASNHRAYCWGDNEDGSLGDGSYTNRSIPVLVNQGAMPSGAMVGQISASGWHTCAIAMNNRAYCWGNNWRNSLGDNTGTNRNSPVLVNQGAMPSGAMVRHISSGQDHNCAISSDNRAYCWGYNNQGQLGDNTTTNRSTPVQVNQGVMPSGAMVKYTDNGETHTCAIASNDKAYCWGVNNLNQLGDGSTTQRRTPAAVSQGDMPGSAVVSNLATSDVGGCAIADHDLIYCWGENDNGQVGNGTSANSSSPSSIVQGAIVNEYSLMSSNSLTLGMEVAPKGASPSCSSVSSGWQSVSSSSPISFGASPPWHGNSIGGDAGDPGAPTLSGFRHQTIVANSAFSNTSSIYPDQTGLWDIVLRDSSSQVSTTYCLRMVSTVSGTSITNYDVFPEITTSAGRMDVDFADSYGNVLNGPATDTAFSNRVVMFAPQTSNAVLADTSSKRLRIQNSQSQTGWTVSVAATNGPSATWQSGAKSYPYNSSASAGQLSVMMSGSSVVAEGQDPSGNACTSAGTSLGSTDTAFASGSIDAITLISGSSGAGFNCIWYIRNIELQQTIPGSQPSGAYSLDLTATVVAN